MHTIQDIKKVYFVWQHIKPNRELILKYTLKISRKPYLRAAQKFLLNDQ